MLQRICSALLLALALTPFASAQEVVPANRPADVDAPAAVEPTPEVAKPAPAAEAAAETQRIRALVEQLSEAPAAKEIDAKPQATPAAATPVAPAKAMPAENPVNLLAAPASQDPKESLALGRGATGVGSAASKSNSSWMLTTLAALGVVVGIILVLRVGITKITGRATASANNPVVEVLSRTSIAPKNHVLLLRLGRRILVVGDSTGGMNTLASIEDPEEVASLLQAISVTKPGSISAGFAQVMQGFDGQYDDEEKLPDQGRDTAEADIDRARDTISGLRARLQSMAAREGA